MSRKLKVADNRQVVTEDGKHHFGGSSFTVDDDHPDVDRWIVSGYVTEPGAKDRTPQQATEEDASSHYVGRARGLNRRDEPEHLTEPKGTRKRKSRGS